MIQALENLKGVEVMTDDILIFGKGKTIKEASQDHERNLKALLDRCRSANIKLNKEKIKLRLPEMPYLGHLISADGLKPDPKKISAIEAMKLPNN